MLDAVLGLLGKVVDALKYAAAFLFVRRSTQIESDRDALAQKTVIQKDQLDIAARPLPDADTVRKRMRDGKL